MRAAGPPGVGASLPPEPARPARCPWPGLHRGARTAAAVRFSALDQMAPVITGGGVELIQAGPGTGGWLLPIALDEVEVQLGRYDAPALTRGTADAGRISVLIPLRWRTPGLWEGCPSDAGALLLYAPAAQQFAFDCEGALWARISVGAEHLAHAFLGATGRDLDLPCASFHRLRPAPASLGGLKQRLRDLPRAIEAAASARRPSRRCLEEQLLRDLYRALGSAANASSHPARGIDPRRIVRAVDEHLKREIHAPVYLADLAAAAKVSERTVEYAFRRLLALTPMHYVKLLRLSRVHRALRDAPPGSTTVTRMALDRGFEHPSQFARDYRSVYGETPSATLRGGGFRRRAQDHGGRA